MRFLLILFLVIYMQSNLYAKIFARRAGLSFFVVMLLLLSCILRVAVISTGNYYTVAAEQLSYRINISRLRGTIYDCNMVPLTNNSQKTVAAVLPTPKGIMAISSCADGEALESALKVLKTDNPTICTVNDTLDGEGITFTTIYEQSTEKLSACHLIGYTDSTGHGVSGLQKAYDDFLYSEKFASALFTVGGNGDILSGVKPSFDNDISIVNSGVVTTIDINFQNIVETAASKLNSGCAIVAEVSNGKIRAVASVPTFDINNLVNDLQNQNSPMLNRALLPYSVGSVFKPCVAAAALEIGRGGYAFNCKGSLEIVDRVFRCHNLSGHGDMDLRGALAQSCNCFFYNFALELGGEPIYKMVSTLSFGSKIKIADNLYAAAGVIPNIKSLNNQGTLANLSIGQGNLLLSPIVMLNLYAAIAGDGCYYLPSVIEKTLKSGEESIYDIGNKTRVMSDKTADVLREYLQSVIKDGTGVEAAPKLCTAAGKTATAQTGRYYPDGSEITNSWFCGFFPAEQPQYVVVVMSDSRLNVSTASIFAEIADKITELEGKNIKNDD